MDGWGRGVMDKRKGEEKKKNIRECYWENLRRLVIQDLTIQIVEGLNVHLNH
ncbi:hypothetical protein Sjap_006462 [Stephania japonica]|uniref:Uncharacterized protein n=1 Tax=Stephania japonica TaxID=461633 RepID=A0AAP0PL30_9MAGN